MKVVGVIVEYNPLHNGHVYHINKIKELSNADIIIAVMSSSITMRGDLSLFNKFEKTRQALNNNIDIVIELPLALSMHKADIFGLNAVKLLSLAKVDEIWIGSEQNDTSIYEKAYEAFNNNVSIIEEKLKEGLSYKEITNNIYSLLSNDLLGYSYFKAIKDNNFDIQLKTIKRINSNYLDKNPTDSNISSALAIRNNIDTLNKYTPEYVYLNKDKIIDENKIFDFLKYKILSSKIESLKELFFVDEGLENKLKEIINFNDLNEFIKYLTTKRYTSTRIKRMLMYVLFNITKNDMNDALSEDINYIRVLGFSNNGKSYLSKIKKDINIYTNIKEGISKILDIELKVSKILDIIYSSNLLINEQKAPITK